MEVEVSPEEKKQHNAERQRRFRQSEKGIAAAARRSERMKIRRAARRNERFARLNRDRSFTFDGRLSGPLVAGIPDLSSTRLPSYREAIRG